MNTYEQPMEPQPKKKHSGYGIAAFVLAMAMLVIGLTGFISFIASVALYLPDHLDTSNPDALTQEAITEAMEPFIEEKGGILAFFGLTVGLSFLCGLIGLILGIVGIMQKDRRKGFAIAGTIINGGATLIAAFFVLIALAAAAGA
ncbi:hypothetical protein ACFQWB_03710 [Paenibacillus thermoaerophilus]|uniref:DUF4064 domain-containing protein n=1 Tax=Paenibacillus thermoaerophilus TaxID=1215385 RepID=A0ABW2UYU0_9BACL|nr:hypothetical protein [Paenibacillus thermoaerophilus]TMV16060.1 hypothetical protein FE781_09570 [Paenibacillus thermoaerophilus]